MELNLWFICRDCGQKGASSQLVYGERCSNCASENVKLIFFNDSKAVVDYVLHSKRETKICKDCVYNRCYLNCYCQNKARVEKIGTTSILSDDSICNFFESKNSDRAEDKNGN